MSKCEAMQFGSDNLPGYVCGDPNSKAAVIVIQEWWGVNDLVKEHAEHIASKSYRCLVPDIYHGKIGVDKEEASHLLSNLDWQRAVQELGQAVQYLKDNGAEKVACIGFCMGGALSLAAAQHCGINAAVPFYGTPQLVLSQPENIKAPCQLHTGALDEYAGFSDAETFKTWADGITKAGVTSAELFIYENCGHAFLNHGDEGTAKRDHMGFPHPNKEDQDLAWNRVFEFFDKHLK